MIEPMSKTHDAYLNLTRGDQNASRRTFIKGVLSMAAAVGTAAALSRFGVTPWVGARGLAASSVVVIGGGISGMRAAWELKKKGKQVTVLDLRPKLGGRIDTRFWPNGAHSEDGMEEFNGGDTFVWDILKTLKVQADQLEAKDAYFFRGIYTDHASGAGGFVQMISELLTDEEEEFYYEIATEISNLAKANNSLEPPITRSNYLQFDTPDFKSWIVNRGGDPVPKAGVERFIETNILAESDARNFEINLFEGLSMYDMYYNDSWWFAHKGNIEIINALAKQLPAGSVRLNKVVKEVRHVGNQVRVTTEDVASGVSFHEDDCVDVETVPGSAQEIFADAAIVSAPAFCVTGAGDLTDSNTPVPGFTHMVPEMSTAKTEALNQVPYASYLFPAFEFPEAYHHTRENLSTWSLNTDTILNYIICQWHNQESTTFNKKNGFLFNYIAADEADAEGQKTDAQVLQDALDVYALFWKSVKTLPWEIRSSFVLRHLDVHYPFMNPGYIGNLVPRLWEPVGERIYFAGDYLNGEGDSNGASQSGLAAAGNIT